MATSFDLLLRFSEMGFECLPGSVDFWLVVPFSDVAGKDARMGDDNKSDVDELSCCLRGFGHVGIVIDCGEDAHDRFGVVVGCTLQGGLGGGQSLWSDGSIGFEQSLHNMWDRALEETCVVIDEVGEAVLIDNSIDLLDDGAFDEVARFEPFGVFGMEFFGCGDLDSRLACQVWEHRIDWSNEGDSGGDTFIGEVAADCRPRGGMVRLCHLLCILFRAWRDLFRSDRRLSLSARGAGSRSPCSWVGSQVLSGLEYVGSPS